MSKTLNAYILHQGSPGMDYYSLFPRAPRVTRRMAHNDAGEEVPLYESPDPFIFNFCIRGVEKRLGVRLPLGSYAVITIVVNDVVEHSLSAGDPINVLSDPLI